MYLDIREKLFNESLQIEDYMMRVVILTIINGVKFKIVQVVYNIKI